MDDGLEVVTLSIASREEIADRMRRALGGERQGLHITFPNLELLWKVISPKRLEILHTMAGQGPLPIREVARRAGRDVKGVHGDVRRLLAAGLLEVGPAGVAFPYAGVHVEFTLRAA